MLLLVVSVVGALEPAPPENHSRRSRTEAHQRLRTGTSPLIDRQFGWPFFNRVTFVSDIRHWGEGRRRATPVELLTTNGGIARIFHRQIPDHGRSLMTRCDFKAKALELNPGSHEVGLVSELTQTRDPDNLINVRLNLPLNVDLLERLQLHGEGFWLNQSGEVPESAKPRLSQGRT